MYLGAHSAATFQVLCVQSESIESVRVRTREGDLVLYVRCRAQDELQILGEDCAQTHEFLVLLSVNASSKRFSPVTYKPE